MEQIKKCLDILDSIQYYSIKTGIPIELYELSIDEIQIMKDIFKKIQFYQNNDHNNRLVVDKKRIDKLNYYIRYYNNILEQFKLLDSLQQIINHPYQL